MNARLALLLPIALLAACDRKGEKTTVEISAGNGSTTISAAPGKDSRLKIDAPGVKADINLPFMTMISDKMEIDGVKLYPGSTIAGVNINADDSDGGHKDGRFALRFQADAPVLAGVEGHPVTLLMAMDANRQLRLKPQNLLVNLPLASVA